jgi:hypothetical protein
MPYKTSASARTACLKQHISPQGFRHKSPCSSVRHWPSALHCSSSAAPLNAGDASSDEDARANTCAQAERGPGPTATAIRSVAGAIVMAATGAI